MLFDIVLKVEAVENFESGRLVFRVHAQQDLVQDTFGKQLVVHVLHNQVGSQPVGSAFLAPRAAKAAHQLCKGRFSGTVMAKKGSNFALGK